MSRSPSAPRSRRLRRAAKRGSSVALILILLGAASQLACPSDRAPGTGSSNPANAPSVAGHANNAAGAHYDIASVSIRGHEVQVELAETPQQQALGLGQRDALPWDTGMLFLYEKPGFYAFWMRGMRFSIDIVWIFKGRIVGIEPSVPFERGGNGPTVRPASLVDSVLEVPAGYAAARGWRTGDRVDLTR